MTVRRAHVFASLLLALALAAPIAARSAPAGRWVALREKAPSWANEALYKAAMKAGPRGVPLPNNVQVPAAVALGFIGIRPGELLYLPIPGGFTLCSSNFVFHNGPNWAIGTAGHCGSVGQNVFMVFAPKVFKRIGYISKSTGDAGIGNDFALISIDPALNKFVSPSMAFWGGPTSAYGGPAVPSLVLHIGWGAGIGDGLPRAGIGTYYSTSKYYFAGAIFEGDSGSGSETGSKAALGNITHIFLGIDGTGFHIGAGTSMPKILQLAGLPLATCASGLPWPYYGCPNL